MAQQILTASQWEAMDYKARLTAMLDGGWEMVSEGPSGAQLKKPKEMRPADKWCVGIGIPLIFFWGIGLLLVAVGVLDYLFFTKEETYFLPTD